MSLLLLFKSSAVVTISGSASQLIDGQNVVDDDGAAVLDADGVQITVPNSAVTQTVVSFTNETTPFAGVAAQTIAAVTQAAQADIVLFGVAAQTLAAVTQAAVGSKPRSAISAAVVPAVRVHFSHATVTKVGGNSTTSTTKTKTPVKKMVSLPIHRIDRRELVETHHKQQRANDLLLSQASQMATNIHRDQVEKQDLRALLDFFESA